MYKLKGHPEQALVHESIEPNELWHRRISHVHYKALLMESKEVLGFLETHEKHEGICKGCAKGKNAKTTFPSSERKAKGIWDILLLDACGRMYSISLRRYVYYIFFIDDFSRKTWINFLK